MNYNYNYNYNEFKGDTNECTSRGACSISPTIAALQELILYYLCHLAYYLLKLEKIGASNPKINENIINDIASLVTINEFSEKQLFSILNRDYLLVQNAKETYCAICAQNGLQPKLLRDIAGFKENTTVSKAISLGEKLFLSQYNKYTQVQKNNISILQILIKSVSIHLIKLSEFFKLEDEAYHLILESLYILRPGKVFLTRIKQKINELAKTDNILQLKIANTMLEEFVQISKVNVSHSSRKGKAILVSGNNFSDLLKILEQTKDLNIDVYTHSNLLIAHAFAKFNSYPNLRAHYGDTTENCILDFSTFPGAILLTKNSRNNTEYLYRGRLFSNDYFVPHGVVKIENNDYSPLIDSALNAKGFSKGKEKPDTTMGFNPNDISKIFNDICAKLKKEEISRLFIIGMNPYSEVQKEYFNNLFSQLQEDEIAINFSTQICDNKNVININVGNFNPLAVYLLEKFFQKVDIKNENIYFFFSNCDVITISNIIFLRGLNTKNIYLAQCTPTLINPSVFATFKKEYKINVTSSPRKDLLQIRKK